MENLKMRKIKGENNKKYLEASSVTKKYFPYLSLSLNELPEAKNWKIGSEYTLVLKVKQKSISLYDNNKEKEGDVSFDIIEIGVPEKMKFL